MTKHTARETGRKRVLMVLAVMADTSEATGKSRVEAPIIAEIYRPFGLKPRPKPMPT